jgi:hypothetical protein
VFVDCSRFYSDDSSVFEFKLDESAPTTVMQIRLSDGRRLKATFNLTHTVRDIQAYLAT